MKKTLLIFALALTLTLPASLWAAATPGVCSQTYSQPTGGFVLVVFTCTGASDDGSIPTQTITPAIMALIKGTHYLYMVTTYRTPAGTAPDAADIAVLMSGMDLLGGKGTNLIHASATQDTFPYSSFMSSYRFPSIVSTITVTVANQGTVSANYTIEIVFVR